MSGFALHLLRHGAPEVPGLLMGRTDGAPTPDGITACIRQATRISFTRLVSSDLSRTTLAARAVGKVHGVPVREDARWRELDFGVWDGLPPSQVDPETIGQFWNDPDAHPPPGGELWSSLVARVSEAIDDLDQAPTLVITHGGAMRAALAVLFGFDHPALWAFDLPCASLLSIQIWPGQPRSAQIIGLRR
ncbi:histidine phosphatase family protein [Croceicoccus estronivorus]|uniref:histidine phosphatase family protein n=1 Tax=Croceicoccus estronivorus TaxID=1172626 RepID=UPI00082C85C8|nr:histidine phosphatase family protein [Croceicoccus estronivorus]OCC24186.1 histidine phosphatase family protein [Croceicoccus estronivorus]